MSSPTEPTRAEMAGVNVDEHRILPPHWQVADLDIGVSLQLDERLGNCVSRESYVEYAAANLAHAARTIKAYPELPLLYFGYLPPGHDELNDEYYLEITWPLSRRGSLERVVERPGEICNAIAGGAAEAIRYQTVTTATKWARYECRW